MVMSHITTRSILSTFLIVIVTFTAGMAVGSKGVLAEQLNRYGLSALVVSAVSQVQPEDVNFNPVWKAWRVLDSRFVDAYATTTDATTDEEKIAQDQERVWGMIGGMTASMGDPYTVFLPPSESEIFNADINGSFEGVGMEIAIRDKILTIVSPLKGTPASLAGLKSGDRIIEIDGKSTKNMGVGGAVKLIRGEKGTDVVFTIVRDGESELLTITVTRDTIQIPTIETERRTDGIFVIELMNFSAKSSGLFKAAIKEFAATKYTRLIIDLRGNPGGFLESAVDMASWFLPTGKIVVTEDFGDNGIGNIHRSRGYNSFNGDIQIVILIDRGSASASEILAGALREQGVATLIGTRSFGKGSVQELINITSDTSLKVTVARWLLPGNIFITKEGIEPDIVVEIPEGEDIDPERDYILEEAVRFLHTGRN